jgi:NAD(P) transhydrogenase subunit alpha
MRIAVPSELGERERRVALTPAAVAKLTGDGHDVVVEAGAGGRAGFSDNQFVDAGATLAGRADVVGSGGVIVGVNGPRHPDGEGDLWLALGPDHVLVGLHDPLWRPENAAKLATTRCTALALELVPRITRAQTMDVLSSMATVVGYEAALLAASRLPKMLPLMMTAAGTIPAAKILVLGAGVAGLQAIATSRRLGAVVEGYDIRPAAVEQIRSMGARAIDLHLALEAGDTETSGGYATEQTGDVTRRQHELLGPHVAEADAVITTAAVPGAPSPELISSGMVEAMAPGSVIIDLAAERGGNCRLTRAGDEVDVAGVALLGPVDLASRAPATSSQLFANNIVSFLRHLAPSGELVIDRDDEITAATLVSIDGELVHPEVAARLDQQNGERNQTGASR